MTKDPVKLCTFPYISDLLFSHKKLNSATLVICKGISDTKENKEGFLPFQHSFLSVEGHCTTEGSGKLLKCRKICVLLWFVKNGCHASCMHLYLHWTPLSPGGTEICVLQAHMHCTGVTGAALKHSLHIHCSLSPQVGTPFSEKLNCTRKEHYLKKPKTPSTTDQPKAQILNRTTNPAAASSASALQSRHCPNTCRWPKHPPEHISDFWNAQIWNLAPNWTAKEPAPVPRHRKCKLS